jgi:iron complex outermembrane recepter protein
MYILRNLFFATFLVVIAAPILAFSQSNGSISGTVSYGDKQSPLHEALVRITELKLSTSTDENGKFEFKNVPPGRYTVLAHLEGFSNSAKTIVLVAGANSTIDFEMSLTSLREQVTVTASGNEQSAFDSLQSVSTVDSNKILERAAVGLGDVLEGQSGVSKRSFGPGNSRPVIRGFDGDRVLVATDGVRVGSLGNRETMANRLTRSRLSVWK